MDWKINYWTVLFAAVAIAWMASALLFTNDPEPATSETEPAMQTTAEKVLDTISANEAVERIKAYGNYATALKSLVNESSLGGKYQVVNPDVLYFHMPHGELQQMVDEWPEGRDVYAYLSLEKQETITDNQIDLIFYDKPDLDTSPESGVIVSGKYFDFTDPCPPLCGGG